MRKKVFLWWSLLAIFTFIVHSCRNDHFPEQETYNNTGKFNLTSKTISLNESKHKSKLVSELSKAETGLKIRKTDASGKVVNYGNGVSIDTDNVIYIENGPNYHTYTFKINRENAPADAPIENLLLSPLPDGTYREFLLTYNFTQKEKQDVLAGKGVDTKGKVQITELAQGTYNGGGQLAKSVCGYVEQTIWVACYTGDHNQSNWQTWHECNWASNGGTPPMVYTTVTYKCIEENDDTITPLEPGGSSGGGGSGGEGGDGTGTSDPPCTTSTVPTNPEPGFTDQYGCPIGVPTLPNLGILPKTPCDKTKVALENPQVQAKINALKQQAQLPSVNPLGGEKGFKIKTDGSVEDASQTAKHEVDYGDLSSYYGAYHNHTLRGVRMLSYKDIDILLALTKHNSVTGPGNAFHGMIAAEEDGNGGFTYLNYVVRFNGTYQDAINFNFTDDQLYGIGKDYEKIVDKLKNDTLLSNDNGFTLNQQGLQKLFFEAAKLMGMENKLILQRVDDDGVKTIQLNSDGSTTAVPCP